VVLVKSAHLLSIKFPRVLLILIQCVNHVKAVLLAVRRGSMQKSAALQIQTSYAKHVVSA
jgi:hypothetical protein